MHALNIIMAFLFHTILYKKNIFETKLHLTCKNDHSFKKILECYCHYKYAWKIWWNVQSSSAVFLFQICSQWGTLCFQLLAFRRSANSRTSNTITHYKTSRLIYSHISSIRTLYSTFQYSGNALCDINNLIRFSRFNNTELIRCYAKWHVARTIGI